MFGVEQEDNITSFTERGQKMKMKSSHWECEITRILSKPLGQLNGWDSIIWTPPRTIKSKNWSRVHDDQAPGVKTHCSRSNDRQREKKKRKFEEKEQEKRVLTFLSEGKDEIQPTRKESVVYDTKVMDTILWHQF